MHLIAFIGHLSISYFSLLLCGIIADTIVFFRIVKFVDLVSSLFSFSQLCFPVIHLVIFIARLSLSYFSLLRCGIVSDTIVFLPNVAVFLISFFAVFIFSALFSP